MFNKAEALFDVFYRYMYLYTQTHVRAYTHISLPSILCQPKVNLSMFIKLMAALKKQHKPSNVKHSL